MGSLDKMSSASDKLVSVVIPTKNSSRTIDKCLKSIREQTWKNIEIIIVDGFSSDNTCDIVHKYDVRLFSLKGERTKAKNLGITESRGKFLLFVDADMILNKKIIEECVDQFKIQDKLNGVIIPEHSIGSSFWVKVRDFERSFYAGSKIESPRFYKKEYVNLVGGFDENIVFFEESTIPQKLEKIGIYDIARIKSYISHDEEEFNLRRWITKKKYYHETAKSYSKEYEEWARLQTSISYRIKLFSSNGKWKKLLRHPILTGGLIILKGLEFFRMKL